MKGWAQSLRNFNKINNTMEQQEQELYEALIALYSYTKEFLEEMDNQVNIQEIPEMEFANEVIERWDL